MSPPRRQLTLRQLMIAVGIVAALLGVGLEIKRRSDYALRRVDWHSSRALDERFKFLVGSLVGGFDWINIKGEFVSTRDRPVPTEEKNHWHLLMIEKYKRAAHFPWLPVATDGLEPE